MVLMSLVQGDIETPMAIFETKEEGRDFLALIPGYQCVEETIGDFTYDNETIELEALPEYMEIEYKENRVPFTKFSFSLEEKIHVYWQEIPNLSNPKQGLIAGNTKVDAYLLPNLEVKEYIKEREEAYQRVLNILHRLGYITSRDFAGSEDGEAILYRKNGEKEAYILTHLDPEFVELAKKLEDENLKEWIMSLVK